MRRIKFFETNDYMHFYYINEIDKFLDNLDVNVNKFNINDILEFVNVLKYIKYLNYGLSHNHQDKKSYMYRQINDFVHQLNDKTFYAIFKKIDPEYFEDFWEFLNTNIKKINLSHSFIKRVFRYKNFYPTYFLQCKSLVKQYESELKNYLLNLWETAELLMSEFEIEHDKRYKNLYFPEFTNEELEKIFDNYIKSNNANLNYLRIIPYLNCEEIKISDNTKLKALKMAKEKTKTLFAGKKGIEFGSEVRFGNFGSVTNVSKKNNITFFDYDVNWVKENLDFPTLLNNFIYLFGFVDKQMRFANLSKNSQLGLFERELELHIKNEYKVGMAFQIMQNTVLMQMIAYNEILKENKVSIEKCLDWFYDKYLKQEFKIQQFITHIENSAKMNFEKCRILFPEIDGIIKQFSIFQEYKEIDHDLIEISSNSVLFENVKSLNKNKYVYPNLEKLGKMNFLMFSDQSGLAYLEGHERYSSLFDLVKNEKVRIKDFQDFHKQDLDWLISNKYLKRNRKGFLEFYDVKQMIIYYDLYFNEFISFYHYPLAYQDIMLKLAKRGVLFFKDTLFSDSEVKYLNYYLNNREVSNGLSLRNRYGHGTQPRKDAEKTHGQNYMYLLYIIVLITIKINDDLCIFDENK